MAAASVMATPFQSVAINSIDSNVQCHAVDLLSQERKQCHVDESTETSDR